MRSKRAQWEKRVTERIRPGYQLATDNCCEAAGGEKGDTPITAPAN